MTNSWKQARDAYEASPWEVCYETCGTAVHVYPGRNMSGFTGIYVHPPNAFERLFGITFEAKIERATRKVQKEVDQLERSTRTEIQNRELVARLNEKRKAREEPR